MRSETITRQPFKWRTLFLASCHKRGKAQRIKSDAPSFLSEQMLDDAQTHIHSHTHTGEDAATGHHLFTTLNRHKTQPCARRYGLRKRGGGLERAQSEPALPPPGTTLRFSRRKKENPSPDQATDSLHQPEPLAATVSLR